MFCNIKTLQNIKLESTGGPQSNISKVNLLRIFFFTIAREFCLTSLNISHPRSPGMCTSTLILFLLSGCFKDVVHLEHSMCDFIVPSQYLPLVIH